MCSRVVDSLAHHGAAGVSTPLTSSEAGSLGETVGVYFRKTYPELLNNAAEPATARDSVCRADDPRFEPNFGDGERGDEALGFT